MATPRVLVKQKPGRKPGNRRVGKRQLARERASGPPAHAVAVKRAQQLVARLHRQRDAWDLFVQGATMLQIGQKLNVSGVTAWRDCLAYRDRLQGEGLADAAMSLARQLEELRKLRLSHHTTRTEKASADVILEALKHEAKLLGLYAPTKVAVTDPTGTQGGVVRVIHEFAQQGEAAVVIDVTPEPKALPE